MWRFGIAAILLLVLVVAVADMFFGGLGSAFGPGSHHPFPWNFGGFVGPDADLRPRGTGKPASDSLAVTRASRVQDLVDPQGRSSVGDDIPPSEGDVFTALAGASDPSIETPSPTYPRARQDAMWPNPVARPSEVPASARDSFGGEQHEPRGASSARNDGDPPRPIGKAAELGIAEVQRRLAALGYDPGPVDGRLGRRTRHAVRKFQRDARMFANGRIDDRLLGRLESEARSRSQSRQQELSPINAPSPNAETSPERGLFGSVLGGLQRLLGRDFDSLRRPAELAAYCHANDATWIYDFGREAFVYCGNVNAGQVAAQASSPSSEASATR